MRILAFFTHILNTLINEAIQFEDNCLQAKLKSLQNRIIGSGNRQIHQHQCDHETTFILARSNETESKGVAR